MRQTTFKEKQRIKGHLCHILALGMIHGCGNAQNEEKERYDLTFSSKIVKCFRKTVAYKLIQL